MECLGRGVSAYLVSIPQASGNDADNLEYDFETATNHYPFPAEPAQFFFVISRTVLFPLL